jgi:hypothetical protein
MTQTTLILVIGCIVLLIGAYLADVRSWRTRSREALIEMIRSADWRRHLVAVDELRRRGEDVDVFLSRFLLLLAAESRIERAAAEDVIRKHYPLLAQQLKDCGSSSMADAATCRHKIEPLLKSYSVAGGDGLTGQTQGRS